MSEYDPQLLLDEEEDESGLEPKDVKQVVANLMPLVEERASRTASERRSFENAPAGRSEGLLESLARQYPDITEEEILEMLEAAGGA